jgi:predicted ATPase/class 3 adenylate cyclase
LYVPNAFVLFSLILKMMDQLIFDSWRSKVYYKARSEWGIPVAVKILNYEFPTPDDIEQFYNEYDLLQSVNLLHGRRVLKKGREKNHHAVWLEWVEGRTLAEILQTSPLGIAAFLPIAISLADALAEIHHQHLIHKDVCPANVIIRKDGRTACVIDFGFTSRLELKQQYVGNPERIEGTLNYVSPEQTGRMNRVLDYRSDLYSLGVTFYEMLSGRLPFAAKDALEVIYAHIAKVPPSLTDVPAPLARIVHRLMAKNAEDRYQSAHGLKRDLARCLDEFAKTGMISDFQLGEYDFSSRFQLPQKLYGRQEEADALLHSFERCVEGAAELVLVKGSSGTGKSALVHEVHKPIMAKRGYFISGKFDQYQRSVPYYALTEAFGELINILLTEREDRLHDLRQRLREALGEEGRVLTDVLPGLEYLVGPQPELPELGGSELQNRFNYIFRKFVQAVCTNIHPLALFIDDLQWADSASLRLLEVLLTDPDIGYLLCVGAYRDNEVDAVHPLVVTIRDIEAAGTRVETLSLDNLPRQDISALVADTLRVSEEEAGPLTLLLQQKTHGNAFFLTRFLTSLYEEKMLQFDFETLCWEWNIQQIRDKNITDNVVELMTAKISRFPAAVQNVLQAGACIGNRFSYDTLAVILGQEVSTLKEHLREGFREGMVLPLGGSSVKFAHDRIQEAVYALIPDDQKKAAHLRIGRLLLENSTVESRKEQLFDIVNQLNSGIDLLDDQQEKARLAVLNLQAGQKARLNSAFQPARNYLTLGIGLLQERPWENQYALCLDLHVEACEAAYLTGEFDEMERLCQEILRNARTILEKVKPCEIRILAYKAQNRLHDAIHTGLEVLAQLGEKFPPKPNLLHVFQGLLATLLRLRGKDNNFLMELPIMTNPEKIAAMRIIADITSSVYWAMPNLLPLIVFRMVALSLRYGNTAVSCFAYGSYGVINCGVLGWMKKGNEYGQLALSLLDKLNAKEWKAQIYVSPYALTIHWRNHVRETLRPLQESFQIGLETGLIEFACVNTNIYCIHSLLCGKPLARLEEETDAYSRSYKLFKQETNYNYNEVYRQAILNFMGKSADPVVLTGTAYDEEQMLRQNEERNDKTGAFFIHFLKTMLGVHFHQPDLALKHARIANTLLEAVLAKFEIPNLHFYHALAALALAENAPARQRRSLLAQARKCYGILRKWAKDAPMNFAHKADLIEAERLRIVGKSADARILYDKAISGANTYEYLQEEALAYELAGRFYLSLEAQDLATYYLKAAYATYRTWGAKAKLRLLERTYSKQVMGVRRSDNLATEVLEDSVSGLSGAMLDISSVLKAAATISGEVVLPRLLSLLLRVVIENAGAQRGVLLLDSEGSLFVETRLEPGSAEAEVLQHLPLEAFPDLAASVVTFVKRTRQALAVADIGQDSRFKNDPYVLAAHPRSVFCLPVIHQGKLIGILYLENNLNTGVFTSDRVNLLSLLSGQIAVSIDNALLYDNLEKKVNERTLELAAEKKKSDDLLYNILPYETAQELKKKGFAEARQYDQVSILFADIVGFTSISEKLSPQDLVREIDTCFRAFDDIMEHRRVEKIKTIGDCYMVAGGLPVPNDTHARDVVQAALDMRDFMTRRSEEGHKATFQMRIGVHSGTVVAGVVGTKKFQYDIWGDAVNTASRMENAGEAGQVNISQTTYDLIKDQFSCTFRGALEAKGKGKVNMYFVEP